METKPTFSANGRPSYWGRCMIQLGRLPTEAYLSRKQRLLLNIPVSVLIVLVGKRFEWIVALFHHHLALLLLSFASSYVIAVLVTSFAHWANRWLDARSDWNHSFEKRLAQQILLPFLGSWILGLLLAWGLFAVIGIGIRQSGYLRFEVWIVFLLLLAMNAGYGFWYMYRHPRVVPPKTATVRVLDSDGKQSTVADKRIGYIAGHHRGVVIHLLDGRKCESRERLTHLANKFDTAQFLLLKRKYLVNIKIVKNIQTVKVPKMDGNKSNGDVAGVAYRHELVFGNSRIKERREPLVKGTLKRVQEWLERNAHRA